MAKNLHWYNMSAYEPEAWDNDPYEGMTEEEMMDAMDRKDKADALTADIKAGRFDFV